MKPGSDDARHVAIETPQRRGHEAVVGLLVVDGEERGQQGVTGGEPHRDQDPGPEIGHLDATDAELVVQPAREGDHGPGQDEADEREEPGTEAGGDAIDDRPDHRLREGDHDRGRDHGDWILEAEARDDQRQQRQQHGLHDDHADEGREPETGCRESGVSRGDRCRRQESRRSVHPRPPAPRADALRFQPIESMVTEQLATSLGDAAGGAALATGRGSAEGNVRIPEV